MSKPKLNIIQVTISIDQWDYDKLTERGFSISPKIRQIVRKYCDKEYPDLECL